MGNGSGRGSGSGPGRSRSHGRTGARARSSSCMRDLVRVGGQGGGTLGVQNRRTRVKQGLSERSHVISSCSCHRHGLRCSRASYSPHINHFDFLQACHHQYQQYFGSSCSGGGSQPQGNFRSDATDDDKDIPCRLRRHNSSSRSCSYQISHGRHSRHSRRYSSTVCPAPIWARK